MEARSKSGAGGGGGTAVAERSDKPQQERDESGSKLPPLLRERPLPLQVVIAGVVPAAFGAICGWVLGESEVVYIVLAAPIAILGGLVAGFDHRTGREGALRGLVGGALFGGFILIVHELTGKEPKADLPDPPIVLAVFTSVIGALLGSVGANWRRDAEEKGTFFDASKISPAELVGALGSAVLAVAVFLPWFSTSASNPHSIISKGNIGPGETASAWQVMPILRWLLLAACTAPFILAWILARGHSLTWRPGEVTMIVGMTTFILILCNGVILGKPDPGIGISLNWGYLVALLGSVGLVVSGYLRQAVYTDARKPPGVL